MDYYNESMYGRRHGPAHIGGYSAKTDKFTLTNIPKDISEDQAIKVFNAWHGNIVAAEIPTSLVCNLDCKYCYITDKWLKNIQVSPDTINSILTLIKQRLFINTTQPKSITPWGAEPFANLDTLELVFDFVEQEGYNLGTSTNGTILNTRSMGILERMVRNKNITNQLQISLDGPKHIQDTYRCSYDKSGSFDRVMEFIGFMHDLDKAYREGKRSYHCCSTIFLSDKTKQEYLDAIQFFGDKSNELVFTSTMPMRVINHILYTPEYRDIFIETMEASIDLLGELSDKNKMVMEDFYIAMSIHKERHYGCDHSFCSAMHSHVGIDLDGGMYLCHSPITSPSIKPQFLFGNLFEGTIDYRAWVKSLDMFSCKMVSYDLCRKCNIVQENGCSNVCLDCPANYVAIDGLPMNYDPYRCEAMKHMYPQWKQYMIETDRRVSKYGTTKDATNEELC